jgi:nicotinamide riboside kinase
VSISGAYCTGKTTLTNDLGAELAGATVVDDECRDVLDVAYPVDWADPGIRSYLAVRQIVVEKLTGDVDYQVIDGGLVNVVGHDRFLLSEPPDRLELVRSLRLPPYDLVLLCDPAGVALVGDGQRYTDPLGRLRLHDLVRDAAEDFGAPVHLMTGPREERLERALSIVRDMGRAA